MERGESREGEEKGKEEGRAVGGEGRGRVGSPKLRLGPHRTIFLAPALF